MHVFLIRHAHALDGPDDARRLLSAKGRRQVREVADFLRGLERFDPKEVWHSGLVRAAETAELLVHRLKVRGTPRRVDELAPDADPRRLGRRLARLTEPVALVGHEPHLSALATLLVGGRPDRPMFILKKGAVLALERQGRRWVASWQISPDLLA